MSARERNLLAIAAMVCVVYLEAAAMVGGLLVGGRHAALVWALYGAALVIVLFLIWGIAVCVVPERMYYAVRDHWHCRCCMWWNIPYQPLPVKPAAKHPADKVPEGNGPITRGDVVVVRRMREEQFHRLFMQSGLSLNLRVPGEE